MILSEHRNLAVRRDHRHRMLEDALQILLADGMEDALRAPAFHNPQRRLGGVLERDWKTATLGDLRQVLARERRIELATRDDDIFRIAAAAFVPNDRQRLGLDFGAHAWVLESLEDRLTSTFLRPRGQQRRADAGG